MMMFQSSKSSLSFHFSVMWWVCHKLWQWSNKLIYFVSAFLPVSRSWSSPQAETKNTIRSSCEVKRLELFLIRGTRWSPRAQLKWSSLISHCLLCYSGLVTWGLTFLSLTVCLPLWEKPNTIVFPFMYSPHFNSKIGQLCIRLSPHLLYSSVVVWQEVLRSGQGVYNRNKHKEKYNENLN